MTTHRQAITMPEWAGKPLIEEEAGWALVMDYEPVATDWEVGLVDLSHRPKALAHGPAAESFRDLAPGQVVWTGQAFVCRRKPQEVVVFDLTGPMEPSWPDDHYTDMTDAWALVALIGRRALELMQRMVIIDVERPECDSAFYAVTRSHGLGLQIVNTKADNPCYLLACDRSHGQNLADGLIRHGRHLGLKPVGLNAFHVWLNSHGGVHSP